DWPRIPLPATWTGLRSSSNTGRRIASLINVEEPVPGVTFGTIPPILSVVGLISREGDGQLDPASGHLSVTASWGFRGLGGVAMPGRGRIVERPYTDKERAAIAAWANPLGLSLDDGYAPLGASTTDVYLNDQ